MVNQNKEIEKEEVLKQIIDLLLDENTYVNIETTYLKDNDKVSDGIEYTTEPGVPTSRGAIRGKGMIMSANAHRARSVKIGKYSMRKFGERGYRVITPEGKDYFFEGNMSTYITETSYVWAAALYRSDNNYRDMKIMLGHVTSNVDVRKGTNKSKFEEAVKNLETLGVSKKNMKYLREHSLSDKNAEK